MGILIEHSTASCSLIQSGRYNPFMCSYCTRSGVVPVPGTVLQYSEVLGIPYDSGVLINDHLSRKSRIIQVVLELHWNSTPLTTVHSTVAVLEFPIHKSCTLGTRVHVQRNVTSVLEFPLESVKNVT